MGLLNLDYEKLMTNPLLQSGLGILANNSGHYGQFAPAFGKGAMQGMQNAQGFAQAQQEALLRKQQMEQQKINADLQQKQFGLQNDKFLQDKQSFDRTNAALDRFKLINPTMADAIEIDPKVALKAAYPNLNTADPYYTPIATEGGLGSFDNRSGKFQPLNLNGRPLIKSTDSPYVRGAVKGAEAQATANWKPNTDIDGSVYTDAQVANMARGGFPASSSGMGYTWKGQPMGAPGTTSTDTREGDANLQLRDPSRPNVGVKILTKAEEAGAKKQAEIRAESTTKKETTMAGVGSVIDQARSILSGPVAPTQSGIGAIYDTASATVGNTPKGAAESDALKAVAGQLVSKMPRMEGPQSNYDVQNYREMAGDVGNATIPIKRRLAALDAMEKIVRKYDKNDAGVKATSKEYADLPKKAPKGQIVRNPATGARKQFNGLTWVDIK